MNLLLFVNLFESVFYKICGYQLIFDKQPGERHLFFAWLFSGSRRPCLGIDCRKIDKHEKA